VAVPPFQDFMLPFMQRISDGHEHRITELFEVLAKEFALTEEELKELFPSGRETRFKNRVHWTRVHLGADRPTTATCESR
jgi:restriction system protein